MHLPSPHTIIPSMARYPKPDRWEGGSEDFAFLRTFDGHVGTNPNIPDPGNRADEGFRRNAQLGFRDIGGHYETHPVNEDDDF